MQESTSNSPTPNVLAQNIGQALLNKNAEKVLLLDLRKLGAVADFFVICSSLSEVHSKTLAEVVSDAIREQYGEKPWKKEGLDTRKWVVLDYVSVVVHIFRQDTRDFYGLERIWGDAETEEIKDPVK